MINPFSKRSVDHSNDMIIAENKYLSFDSFKTRRNNNVLIVGDQRSYKESFLIPNILQMQNSYVVDDPDGDIYQKTWKMLSDNGYRVIVISSEADLYMHTFNPFPYFFMIKDGHREIDDEAVSEFSEFFARKIMFNYKWNAVMAETVPMILQFVIKYVIIYCDEDEWNLETVLRIFRYHNITNKDGTDGFYAMMEESEKKFGDSENFTLYHNFLTVPERKREEILDDWVRCLERFLIFRIKDPVVSIDDVLSLGDEKCALFLQIPDNDIEYEFIKTEIILQTIGALYKKKDYFLANSAKDRSYHIMFFFRYFEEMFRIDKFMMYSAAMRPHNMSFSLFIEASHFNRLNGILSDQEKKRFITIGRNCDVQIVFEPYDDRAVIRMDVKSVFWVHENAHNKKCVAVIRGNGAEQIVPYDIKAHKNYQKLNMEEKYDN